MKETRVRMHGDTPLELPETREWMKPKPRSPLLDLATFIGLILFVSLLATMIGG